MFLSSQTGYTKNQVLAKWQLSTLPGTPSLRGCAIFNDTLWVTGSNNSVFTSKDFGSSWQNISVNSKIITDFRDIEVLDDTTAIFMGAGTGQQSRLFITRDLGKSWQPLLYQNNEKLLKELGFYTLTSNKDIYLGAGPNDTVGVLRISITNK